MATRRTAYQVLARDEPTSDSDKVDSDMLAGFIALRALGDAKTAYKHFSAVHKRSDDSGHHLARALLAGPRARGDGRPVRRPRRL